MLNFNSSTRQKSHRYLLESMIALLLLVVSFFVAYHEISHYRQSNGNQIHFYQNFFEPAVLIACGHGFGTFEPPVSFETPFGMYLKPEVQQIEKTALYDFLTQKLQTFDCSLLPKDKTILRDPPQRIWYHLLATVGFFWKITGISWAAIDILVAMLFAITTIICYGLFRLGMNKIFSVFFTVILMGSGLQLTFLPWYRDYAKAPFILGVCLLLGLVVTQPFKKLNLLLLAALCGVLLGVGYGFRADLIVMIVPAVLTFLFFVKGPFFKNIPIKILSILIMAAAILLTIQAAMPRNSEKGSCIADNAIMGLTPKFSAGLKVAISPVYEIVNAYNDLLTFALVSTHADHFLKLDLIKGLPKNDYSWRGCTPDYDKASLSIYNQLIELFPADFMIRSFASMHKILSLGFLSWQDEKIDPWQNIVLLPTDNFFSVLYKITRPMLGKFSESGVFVWLITTFLMGVFNLRMAIFFFLGIVFLSFYPAIQFNPRHYFHLEFISLWCLGFILYQVFYIFRLKQRFAANELKERIIHSGLVIAGLCLVPILILKVTQNIQGNQIKKLVSSYQQGEQQAIAFSKVIENNDCFITLELPNKEFSEYAGVYPKGKMLVLEFSRTKQMNDVNIDVTFAYALNPSVVPHFDFSKTEKIVIKDGKTVIYAPIYRSEYFNFSGIRINKEDAVYLEKAYLLNNVDNVPWIFLNLPPDWDKRPLYQQLSRK